MVLQHKHTHKMIISIMGCPLNYRFTNNTLKFKFGRYLHNCPKKNTTSNMIYSQHVTYAHSTKMAHAPTYYPVAVVNT